ncbi:hypothetical protein L0P85_03945 [Terrisporobacter glycolicus]|nr:hypothetical protein L0P85_03945 [Terrisporobacter glycolicus]
MNKVKKCYDYIYNRLYLIIKEKKYVQEDIELKYIFEEHQSDVLCIVFSACTRKGIKARYNYIRTLKKYKVNKLFILDDYGYDSRGVYYLGKDSKFDIEKVVENLIKKIKHETNAKKCIFLGSSKGGYASLYFGMNFNDSIIIAGAPQYYLGEYLKGEANCHILEYIMGDKSEASINYLNQLLPQKINNSTEKFKIYIHCSKEEHTYKNHISYLIYDLKENNHNVESEILNYHDHNEVGLYFPKYLCKVLDNLIEEKVAHEKII